MEFGTSCVSYWEQQSWVSLIWKLPMGKRFVWNESLCFLNRWVQDCCFKPVDVIFRIVYLGAALQTVREKLRQCVQRCRYFAQEEPRNSRSIDFQCFRTSMNSALATFKVIFNDKWDMYPKWKQWWLTNLSIWHAYTARIHFSSHTTFILATWTSSINTIKS